MDPDTLSVPGPFMAHYLLTRPEPQGQLHPQLSLCYYCSWPAQTRLWFSLTSRRPRACVRMNTGLRTTQRSCAERPNLRPRLHPAGRPSSPTPRPPHTSLPLGESPAPPPASHSQMESLLPSHEREGTLKADGPVSPGPSHRLALTCTQAHPLGLPCKWVGLGAGESQPCVSPHGSP